jgi:TM2 domain-containing membrane protein YozV
MPKFCTQCGTLLENENVGICPACGAQFAAPVPAATGVPANPVPPVNPGMAGTKQKSPGVAAVLSFVFPGLGQVCNGDTGRGILFLIGTLIGSLLLVIPGLIIWVYQIYDAYKTAQRMNAGEIPFKEADSTQIILYIVALIAGMVLFIILTLIISAVIAAFVFGMAGNVSKIMVVAATVQQPDSTHMVITYQGGQDADKLRQIAITVTDSYGILQTKTMGSSYSTSALKIGTTAELTGKFSGKDHVIATGIFSDGTRQTILDTYV